ncbi:MAG: glutamate synthase-related protein, partial [Dehalococcoidales bacterium]|nr:glutamate synthase-related protein [Dehalococcoidales bacterium]
MPRKYVIHPKVANPRFPPIGKYATVEFREDCAGSCRLCVKKKCVYGIFKDNFLHWSQMTEPEYLYTCKSCYRCVEECTKGIFSMVVNPDYLAMGDDYWTPGIISSTWGQAHTGKIPVSGAGYRGPFVGEGFDSIWTDMSEIVRPTRDGIHGREYINTMVELSRRPMRLKFNGMSLDMDLPQILEIPLPVLFEEPQFGVLSEEVLVSMARAAGIIGNLMLIQPESYTPSLSKYADRLIPCLTRANYRKNLDLVRKSQMVELAYEPGIEQTFAELRLIKPGLFISVGMPLDADAAGNALSLAGTDVDTIHLYGSPTDREVNAVNPRYLKDMIREVHLKLVENRLRPKVNLVVSGGIAMAEHVAKSLICGADAVAIDTPLLIALECRLCYRCKEGKSCPVQLEAVESKWGSQRIVNLMGAWHNQLLEVMGAFGIREARRMRGEVGRSMWFDDLE